MDFSLKNGPQTELLTARGPKLIDNIFNGIPSWPDDLSKPRGPKMEVSRSLGPQTVNGGFFG